LAEQLSGLRGLDPDINFLLKTSSDYYDESSFNDLLEKQSINENNFSMTFLNIRSAPKNLESFQYYLNNFKIDFSIIGLAETWLNQDSESLCHIPNYKSHYLSRQNKHGGGVGLLVSNLLNFKHRTDLDLLNDCIECTFIEIVSKINSQKPLVGVIYRPPNTDCNRFLEHLEEILNKIRTENKVVYIMGDFNLNLLNSESHSKTNEFLDLLYSSCFRPLIDKPTRITEFTSTLIDNVFYNGATSDSIAGILYADISDHLPLFIISRSHSNLNSTSEPNTIKFRKFTDAAKQQFKEKLQSLSWNELYSITDTERAYNFFIQKITDEYQLAFPLAEKTIKKVKNHHPWLSESLKKSIKQKNKLYKKFHHRPTVYNEIAFKIYKKYLEKTLKAAKKLYYDNQLTINKHNLKQTWKIMKEIIGIPTKESISQSFTSNGRVILDKNEIADSFNEYFVNIGEQLASKIPSSVIGPLNFMNPTHNNSIFLAPTTPNEILNCLGKLKDGSPGHDGLKPNIIKLCKNELVSPLLHIFNLSLAEGHVPLSLKKANTTPVFKAGDPTIFSNYRPISVLPVFAKVIERIMFTRTYSFLDSQNILSDNQFGFRKGLSTEMALITAIDYITDSLDKKSHTAGVFLDLSKAFDTVNHNILLSKLSHYGIRGSALHWFKSYLSGRTQGVKYNDVLSSQRAIDIGVPQGSILGPLLFIIYINDLPNVVPKLKSVIFADDTTLFLSGKDLSEIECELNSELKKLSQWFESNKLSINIKKTHYMLFSLHKNLPSRLIDVKINGTSIERVANTKFLGVYIDEYLNWVPHINHVCKKLRKSVGILKKVKTLLNEKSMATLYYSLLYPYLTYCHLIWGNAASTHLNRITILQKKAIRLICAEDYLAHTDPLFQKTKIIRFQELYKYFTLLFVSKIKNNLLPISFRRQVKLDLSDERANPRSTRFSANQTITLPLYRTSLRQKTIFYQLYIAYNDFFIPLELNEIVSYKKTKRILKNIFSQ